MNKLNQWGKGQEEDTALLDVILTLLKRLKTALGSLSTAAGWTDDGTDVRLTTITDKVGIGIANATHKLHVVGDDAKVLSISGTVNTGVDSGIEITNEIDGDATLIGARFYVTGATYDSSLQLGTVAGDPNTQLGLFTATAESSITLGAELVELHQNTDGGISVILGVSDTAGTQIQGKDSTSSGYALRVYDGNATAFGGNQIASFRNDKQVTLNGLAGTGDRIVQVSSTGVISATKPAYKVYTALLTQTGTDAPVATVLENTLGGAVVWSYMSVGVYEATLAGAFTSSKTVVFVNNFNQNDGIGVTTLTYVTNAQDGIIFVTVDGGNANVEWSTLSNVEFLSIEIRVYP